MRVDIFSRPSIEKLLLNGVPRNTAIISFYDPESKRTSADYTPVIFPSSCA